MPPSPGYLKNEMERIFESWDYHLQEKLDAADHIVRRMTYEMTTAKIPHTVYLPYLQAKLSDMVQNIAKEEMKRA